MSEAPERIVCRSAALIIPSPQGVDVIPWAQKGHGGNEALETAKTEYRRADTVIDRAVAEKMAEGLRAASAALRVDHFSGEPHPARAEVLEALDAFAGRYNTASGGAISSSELLRRLDTPEIQGAISDRPGRGA